MTCTAPPAPGVHRIWQYSRLPLLSCSSTTPHPEDAWPLSSSEAGVPGSRWTVSTGADYGPGQAAIGMPGGGCGVRLPLSGTAGGHGAERWQRQQQRRAAARYEGGRSGAGGVSLHVHVGTWLHDRGVISESDITHTRWQSGSRSLCMCASAVCWAKMPSAWKHRSCQHDLCFQAGISAPCCCTLQQQSLLLHFATSSMCRAQDT